MENFIIDGNIFLERRYKYEKNKQVNNYDIVVCSGSITQCSQS